MRMRWMALFVMIALPVFAGKKFNDFDPDASYEKFKTFSFIAGIDMSKSGILDDPERRKQIANFVSGILENRGLREVPKDEKHDLDIRVWVARKDRQDVTVTSYGSSWYGPYDPFWYGPWGFAYEEYVVKNYVEGTLIIDLIDPSNKQLVWRTFLRQDIKENRMKAYEKAKKSLNECFSDYPPSEEDKQKKRKDRASHPGA